MVTCMYLVQWFARMYLYFYGKKSQQPPFPFEFGTISLPSNFIWTHSIGNHPPLRYIVFVVRGIARQRFYDEWWLFVNDNYSYFAETFPTETYRASIFRGIELRLLRLHSNFPEKRFSRPKPNYLEKLKINERVPPAALSAILRCYAFQNSS